MTLAETSEPLLLLLLVLWLFVVDETAAAWLSVAVVFFVAVVANAAAAAAVGMHASVLTTAALSPHGSSRTSTNGRLCKQWRNPQYPRPDAGVFAGTSSLSLVV
jgi:hypothetical protein